MLKKGEYPYPEEKIFYAVHKEGNNPVTGLRLMKAEKQGIYVGYDIDYLSSYISAFAPGENPTLTFYYTLKDLKDIRTMMKNKDQKKIINIAKSIIPGKKQMFCYTLPGNIRMVSFILADSIEDVQSYVNRKRKTNYKMIFNMEDLEAIIEEMNLVKTGESNSYNFIVE